MKLECYMSNYSDEDISNSLEFFLLPRRKNSNIKITPWILNTGQWQIAINKNLSINKMDLSKSDFIHFGTTVVATAGIIYWTHTKISELQEDIKSIKEQLEVAKKVINAQSEIIAHHEKILSGDVGSCRMDNSGKCWPDENSNTPVHSTSTSMHAPTSYRQDKHSQSSKKPRQNTPKNPTTSPPPNQPNTRNSSKQTQVEEIVDTVGTESEEELLNQELSFICSDDSCDVQPKKKQ